MRKLKLESLQVESFETVARSPRSRGTVQGHVGEGTGGGGTGISGCATCEPVTITYDRDCAPRTYDATHCPPTEYPDCTFQCTYTQERTCDCPIGDDSSACPVE